MSYRRTFRTLLTSLGLAAVLLLVLELGGRVALRFIQPGRLRIHPTAFVVPEGTDRAELERLAEAYSRELAASSRARMLATSRS